jgi:hypothetical protein
MKRVYLFLSICLLVCLFFNLVCAPSYKQFWWRTESVEDSPSGDFVVTATSLYDSEHVLRLGVSVRNFSGEDVEIEDIILTDRYNIVLYPLSPEGVAYAYLGDPPPDFPPPPPRPSSKRFIVTGYVREFPKDHYSGQFEIEEQTTSHGSLLDGYLAGMAYRSAQYKVDFQKIVYNISRISFNTDKVYAGTENKGTLYFREGILHCPLTLEVRIRKSETTFRYNYKIYPPTKK